MRIAIASPRYCAIPPDIWTGQTVGAGLGACGQTYSVNDFIVALSQSTFGLTYRSKYCDKEIIISYGGKTARAKIVDAVRSIVK